VTKNLDDRLSQLSLTVKERDRTATEYIKHLQHHTVILHCLTALH